MNLKLNLIINFWFLISLNNFLHSQVINSNKDSVNVKLYEEILIDSLTKLGNNFNSNYDFSELLIRVYPLKFSIA